MNRYVRPIMFGFEPDLVFVFGRASFGAAGAPTLSPTNSKGICNWALNTVTTVATTTNSSASVTAAVSLFGVYNGMSVTGTGIPASTTVSAVNPGAGTFTLSNAATASGSPTLTFSGGQYVITFGSQYTPFKRLDSYVKLVNLTYNWDPIANEKAVSASTPSSPAAPFLFLIQNQITLANQTFTATGSQTSGSASVTAVSNVGPIYPGMAVTGSGIQSATTVIAVGATTITLSKTASSTIANNVLTFTPTNPSSVVVQVGSLSGATFTAANPASGEILRLGFTLVRSNAM